MCRSEDVRQSVVVVGAFARGAKLLSCPLGLDPLTGLSRTFAAPPGCRQSAVSLRCSNK
jgi:hypothetical protein